MSFPLLLLSLVYIDYCSGNSRITMLVVLLCRWCPSMPTPSRWHGAMIMWLFLLLTIMYGPSPRAPQPSDTWRNSFFSRSSKILANVVCIAFKTVARLCSGDLQKLPLVKMLLLGLVPVTRSRNGFCTRFQANEDPKLTLFIESHCACGL